jgi:hypothetical protein
MWDPPPHYFQVGLSASRQLSLVPNVKSACSDIAKREIVLAISRLAELDIHSRGAWALPPLIRGGSFGSGVGDVRSPHI